MWNEWERRYVCVYTYTHTHIYFSKIHYPPIHAQIYQVICFLCDLPTKTLCVCVCVYTHTHTHTHKTDHLVDLGVDGRIVYLRETGAVVGWLYLAE